MPGIENGVGDMNSSFIHWTISPCPHSLFEADFLCMNYASNNCNHDDINWLCADASYSNEES